MLWNDGCRGVFLRIIKVFFNSFSSRVQMLEEKGIFKGTYRMLKGNGVGVDLAQHRLVSDYTKNYSRFSHNIVSQIFRFFGLASYDVRAMKVKHDNKYPRKTEHRSLMVCNPNRHFVAYRSGVWLNDRENMESSSETVWTEMSYTKHFRAFAFASVKKCKYANQSSLEESLHRYQCADFKDKRNQYSYVISGTYIDKRIDFKCTNTASADLGIQREGASVAGIDRSRNCIRSPMSVVQKFVDRNIALSSRACKVLSIFVRSEVDGRSERYARSTKVENYVAVTSAYLFQFGLNQSGLVSSFRNYLHDNSLPNATSKRVLLREYG